MRGPFDEEVVERVGGSSVGLVTVPAEFSFSSCKSLGRDLISLLDVTRCTCCLGLFLQNSSDSVTLATTTPTMKRAMNTTARTTSSPVVAAGVVTRSAREDM